MDVTFLQPETGRYFLILFLSLTWLAGLAISARYSRLPTTRRPWVNLVSLLTGPIGWAFHIASYRSRSKTYGHVHEAIPALPLNNTRKETGATSLKSTRREIPGLSWLRNGKRNASRAGTGVLTELMLEAIAHEATDIHLEPHHEHYLARFRVNGILRDYQTYPRATGDRILSIAKVMATLDVADKLKPQDGRLEWEHPHQALKLDVRVSVSPSLRGEKMALRLLNRPASSLDMESLGMNEAMRKALTRALRHPEGLILIAGPTGSGKTSTGYSLLSRLAGSAVNIMTIEDPIEYTLPDATQIAVNPKLGITFQSGLPTLLRQDPDIILIGEMRDSESFRIGIRASLSGHLVISTLHARSAVQVFANLRNIGVETSSLTTAVKLVVAQRLVRVLCPDCKVQDTELDDDAWNFLGSEAEEIPVYQPGNGCDRCYQSGFIGRTGVFEFMTVDSTVREWLEREQHESDLERTLREQGWRTIRDDARDKVFAGTVWAEDAIRATGITD